MFHTRKDLFKYISDFYSNTDMKLNSLNQQIAMLKKQINCLYGLNNNPENLPDAYGHLKLKQVAIIKLLRIVDHVLSDAGIQYFLGYGSLLGAARGGKFIPWDDDADICLMRDEFNRAIPVLEQRFNSGNFSTKYGFSGGLFKVVFDNSICVDLFPWDFYHKRMHTPEERDKFMARYNQAMTEARIYETQDSYSREYGSIRDSIIMGNIPADCENGDIYEGIDWQTGPERMTGFIHSRPFHHEYIFPLGKIEFEGYEFPAPADVDACLAIRFGDWHSFNIDIRHSPATLWPENIAELKRLVANESFDIRDF